MALISDYMRLQDAVADLDKIYLEDSQNIGPRNTVTLLKISDANPSESNMIEKKP